MNRHLRSHASSSKILYSLHSDWCRQCVWKHLFLICYIRMRSAWFRFDQSILFTGRNGYEELGRQTNCKHFGTNCIWWMNIFDLTSRHQWKLSSSWILYFHHWYEVQRLWCHPEEKTTAAVFVQQNNDYHTTFLFVYKVRQENEGNWCRCVPCVRFNWKKERLMNDLCFDCFLGSILNVTDGIKQLQSVRFSSHLHA